MISWTSPRGEKLTLRPCWTNDGRTVIEVLDGTRLLTVADLETGEDIDASVKRTRIAVAPWIIAKLRQWNGKLEVRAA